MDEEMRAREIERVVRAIEVYFNARMKGVLRDVKTGAPINNYTFDMAICDDGPYFIEINTFGAEMAAGSALFKWTRDAHMLMSKGDEICFRYCM